MKHDKTDEKAERAEKAVERKKAGKAKEEIVIQPAQEREVQQQKLRADAAGDVEVHTEAPMRTPESYFQPARGALPRVEEKGFEPANKKQKVVEEPTVIVS